MTGTLGNKLRGDKFHGNLQTGLGSLKMLLLSVFMSTYQLKCIYAVSH